MKNHLLRMECIQDDVCSFCCKEITAEQHILLDCGALADKMRKYLGKEFLDSREIKELGLTKLSLYCSALQLGTIDFFKTRP